MIVSRLQSCKVSSLPFLASAMCHQDFDDCIILYKDFIKQSGEALQFKITAVGNGGADDGGIMG